MKKILLVIIVAIAIGLYYIFTNINSIVKTAIENYGSQTTKTAVNVDNVKIKLTDGAGAISGLSIANPKGFESKNAFALGAIETQIDIKSLAKEPITIDKIIVRKPQIFYELNKSGASNLNELYKNIAASGGTNASKPAAKSNEPKLIIRRFQLADATIDANVVPLNKKYTLKLPAIELQNLGGKNGATPSEISRQILDTITQRALAAVKQAGIDDKVQAIKSEAKEKVQTKTREAESRAKEKLKGVLGK